MSEFERCARDHAQSRASLGTRHGYLADLERWLIWCAAHGHDPARPELAAASQFRDELAAALAAQTVRRALAALSSMYEAALGFEQPRATWNPFKRLPRPPASLYSKTEAIADEAAQKILAAAAADPAPTGQRDVVLLSLLYDTGLRRASVASLRWDAIIRREVRDEHGQPAVQTVLRVVVKGGKEREVVVPGKTASMLLALPRSGKFVFAKRGVTGFITPSAINKIVGRRAASAGVTGVHPHQFRTAFATTALDSGRSLVDVQRAMHHADPSTTLRYDRGQRGVGVTEAVAKFREKKG